MRAAEKIATLLPRTPLLPLDLPGGGPNAGKRVWCKAESLQPMGAFKIRGAWHRMTDLAQDERAAGVVAVSSGNHAQGVALAGKLLRIGTTIVMPRDAPAVKLERTLAYGAQVVPYDRHTESRDAIAAEICARTGSTLVHAYGDPWVIEGQGSMGIEIAAQMDERWGGPPTRIVAPCGGGGLSAGLALACPDAQVVGVEPEGWDDIRRSLELGQIVPVEPGAAPTQCDALMATETREVNFTVLRNEQVQVTSVTDAEVRAAQRLAFAELRLVIEPGGAAGLAAVLAGKVPVDGRTAVVLSGGNTDGAAFAKVLTGD